MNMGSNENNSDLNASGGRRNDYNYYYGQNFYYGSGSNHYYYNNWVPSYQENHWVPLQYDNQWVNAGNDPNLHQHEARNDSRHRNGHNPFHNKSHRNDRKKSHPNGSTGHATSSEETTQTHPMASNQHVINENLNEPLCDTHSSTKQKTSRSKPKNETKDKTHEYHTNYRKSYHERNERHHFFPRKSENKEHFDTSKSTEKAGLKNKTEAFVNRRSKTKEESNSSRGKTESLKTESKELKKPETDCDENQREMLDEQLRRGSFECMVCCEVIRVRDNIWSCQNCYNIFHLKCIKTWANSAVASFESNSSNNDIHWRCPACQGSYHRIPTRYFCFCGKARDPELNRYLVPHSCGEMCARPRKSPCPHKCNILCHPGPCPPCEAKITRECACGKSKVVVNCATQDENVTCNNICGKRLQCGIHLCEKTCHSGKCGECNHVKSQICFCGKEKREIDCNEHTVNEHKYCCNNKCGKMLSCRNHVCEQVCHAGDCMPCLSDPKLVTNCPCGKTRIESLTNNKRKSCLDPIPVCNQVCNKELVCGPKDSHHVCKMKCHEGACPPCDQKTIVRCRCGANSESVECQSLSQADVNVFICKKRCNKKRQCGRHKCLSECCIDDEHKCDQICGKKLKCGSHSCQEVCHYNTCPPCWNISWEELTCRCGSAVVLPPIACGTKRPECNQICSRIHPCGHPITHHCHDDVECPPCTHLGPKYCYGSHTYRNAIPCYQDGVSCGSTCLKPLSCGIHECQKICHPGDCGECMLPCPIKRDDCEHACGLKCHQASSQICPKTKCKIMMEVTCACERKKEQMPCNKVNDEASCRVPLSILADVRIKNGESINVADILKSAKEYKYIRLKCDEKCSIYQRNKNLAEALDIKDADFSPDPGPPNYSELLKDAARTDPKFVSDIYDTLSKLVIESKQTKLSFKNFNFPAMNSHQRHIIHELSEFFGCKSHAIDKEPNRSVVVKAIKDKCYLPTVNIMQVVNEPHPKSSTTHPNKIILKNCSFDQDNNLTKGNIRVSSNQSNANNSPIESKVIDYFDYDGK